MIAILLILSITLTYYFFKKSYQYWDKNGINGPKPTFLFGNMKNSCLFKESPGKIYQDIYKAYDDEEMVGIYRSISPVLLVRDPDLIKKMLVASFNNFHDNDFYVDKKQDPIAGRNPFMLKGEEWKVVRSQLTPAFTSGKMKWLYPLLDNVARDMVKFIEKKSQTIEGYEAKELSVRFTLNNIATCAFGVEGKCFEEDNGEFKQLYNEFLSPDSWGIFTLFIASLFPQISKVLPLRLVPKSAEQKIINIVSDTIKHREENNVQRNDLFQMLTELKNSSKHPFSDVDVSAQLATFFTDGSETSSIFMSFTLFALAENGEAQKKLRKEVTEAFSQNKDELPFEVLQNLPYLDAVMNESLRLHTPTPFIQKVCTEDFNYQMKKRNKSVRVEKGTSVIISLSGIHQDGKYFDRPLSFRPERFLEDNSFEKDAFLPFGTGPRTCLGRRFALLQIKTGVVYIVKNFELSVNSRTQLPLKYNPQSPFLDPIGGLWLNFKKIV